MLPSYNIFRLFLACSYLTYTFAFKSLTFCGHCSKHTKSFALHSTNSYGNNKSNRFQNANGQMGNMGTSGNMGGMSSMGGMGNPDDMSPPIERSTIPSRNDICKIFISGVIGSEPKENYLSNGHLVMSFSLATG